MCSLNEKEKKGRDGDPGLGSKDARNSPSMKQGTGACGLACGKAWQGGWAGIRGKDKTWREGCVGHEGGSAAGGWRAKGRSVWRYLAGEGNAGTAESGAKSTEKDQIGVSCL